MIRFFAVAAAASVLFACGGGAKLAPTKEAAAQALFGASQKSPDSSAQSAIRHAVAAAGASVSYAVDCEKGGKVSIALDFSAVNSNGDFTYDLNFDNCSHDGETRMSGTLKTTISFSTDSSSSFNLNLGLKGRVNFSGAVDDFVEANVVQSVSVSALDQTSGSVSVILNGTIRTSAGLHTYDSSETITFTARGYTTASDGNT